MYQTIYNPATKQTLSIDLSLPNAHQQIASYYQQGWTSPPAGTPIPPPSAGITGGTTSGGTVTLPGYYAPAGGGEHVAYLPGQTLPSGAVIVIPPKTIQVKGPSLPPNIEGVTPENQTKQLPGLYTLPGLITPIPFTNPGQVPTGAKVIVPIISVSIPQPRPAIPIGGLGKAEITPLTIYNNQVESYNHDIELLNTAYNRLNAQYTSKIQGNEFLGSQAELNLYNNEVRKLNEKANQLDKQKALLDNKWSNDIKPLYIELPDGKLMLKTDYEIIQKQDKANEIISGYLSGDSKKTFLDSGTLATNDIDSIVQSMGNADKAATLFHDAGFTDPNIVSDAVKRNQYQKQYGSYIQSDGTVDLTGLLNKIEIDTVARGGVLTGEYNKTKITNQLVDVAQTFNFKDFDKNRATELVTFSMATPEHKFEIMKASGEGGLTKNDFYTGVDEKTGNFQYVTFTDDELTKARAQEKEFLMYNTPGYKGTGNSASDSGWRDRESALAVAGLTDSFGAALTQKDSKWREQFMSKDDLRQWYNKLPESQRISLLNSYNYRSTTEQLTEAHKELTMFLMSTTPVLSYGGTLLNWGNMNNAERGVNLALDTLFAAPYIRMAATPFVKLALAEGRTTEAGIQAFLKSEGMTAGKISKLNSAASLGEPVISNISNKARAFSSLDRIAILQSSMDRFTAKALSRELWLAEDSLLSGSATKIRNSGNRLQAFGSSMIRSKIPGGNQILNAGNAMASGATELAKAMIITPSYITETPQYAEDIIEVTNKLKGKARDYWTKVGATKIGTKASKVTRAIPSVAEMERVAQKGGRAAKVTASRAAKGATAEVSGVKEQVAGAYERVYIKVSRATREPFHYKKDYIRDFTPHDGIEIFEVSRKEFGAIIGEKGYSGSAGYAYLRPKIGSEFVAQRVLIVVRGKDATRTLAHELGHAIAGHTKMPMEYSIANWIRRESEAQYIGQLILGKSSGKIDVQSIHHLELYFRRQFPKSKVTSKWFISQVNKAVRGIDRKIASGTLNIDKIGKSRTWMFGSRKTSGLELSMEQLGKQDIARITELSKKFNLNETDIYQLRSYSLREGLGENHIEELLEQYQKIIRKGVHTQFIHAVGLKAKELKAIAKGATAEAERISKELRHDPESQRKIQETKQTEIQKRTRTIEKTTQAEVISEKGKTTISRERAREIREKMESEQRKAAIREKMETEQKQSATREAQRAKESEKESDIEKARLKDREYWREKARQNWTQKQREVASAAATRIATRTAMPKDNELLADTLSRVLSRNLTQSLTKAQLTVLIQTLTELLAEGQTETQTKLKPLPLAQSKAIAQTVTKILVKPQPETKIQTKPQEEIETKITEKTKLKIKVPINIPIPESAATKKKLIKAGTVAWKQGLFYKVAVVHNRKLIVLTTKQKPEGVPIVKGIKSAFKTLTRKGQYFPPEAKYDMGIMDVKITKKGKQIRFVRDIKRKTHGNYIKGEPELIVRS